MKKTNSQAWQHLNQGRCQAGNNKRLLLDVPTLRSVTPHSHTLCFKDVCLRSPQSVKALEQLGRVRLSDSFFMRDFLYSEISQIERIPNLPEYPDIAVEAGRGLCQNVLEPIQSALGRISIRSGYRAPAVNAKGAENKNQYNCSSNESNYADHFGAIETRMERLAQLLVLSLIRLLITTTRQVTGKR
jgi:hypothetical protein